jgi:hypothetical protein
MQILINKPLIKIYKFKENLNVIKRFKLYPFNNIINPLKVYLNTFSFYNKIKNLNL